MSVLFPLLVFVALCVRSQGPIAPPSATVDALIVDLLLWLQVRERSYEEVIDAWRTSCPKLTVWEDANDCNLVVTKHLAGREIVRITPAGLAFLEQARKTSKSSASSPAFRPA